VNTCRGKVVVEEDLAEALKSGKVRAYGTDVWFSDPPAPECPLLSAPNVYMAPTSAPAARRTCCASATSWWTSFPGSKLSDAGRTSRQGHPASVT